jgi:hypothetical protein
VPTTSAHWKAGAPTSELENTSVAPMGTFIGPSAATTLWRTPYA